MKTPRLSVKWIPFWMVALSAGALCCEGNPSRREADEGQAMAGAGGASDTAAGSPSDTAGGSASDAAAGGGGSPSDTAAGGPSEAAGGGPSDAAGGSGGSPSDTDPGPTDVEWLGVASGSFPGGDGSGLPCRDVEVELLHDQAELDQWKSDQGITASLEFIVDWTTQSALGAVTSCSTSSHLIEGGALAHDGSGELTAEFTVTDLQPSFGVSTVVWTVFQVEGRAWAGVSATTIE